MSVEFANVSKGPEAILARKLKLGDPDRPVSVINSYDLGTDFTVNFQ